MTENPYADMLDHPRHISLTRRHLTNVERAAQYLPYAALTGYDEVVNEEIRRTDSQAELDEYEVGALDRKLQYLRDHIEDRQKVNFTYFKPDKRKNGGAYFTTQGVVKKVDEYERLIILEDETAILIENIASVELPEGFLTDVEM